MNSTFHRYVVSGVYPIDWCGDLRVEVSGGDSHSYDYAALIVPTVVMASTRLGQSVIVVAAGSEFFSEQCINFVNGARFANLGVEDVMVTACCLGK